MTSIVTGGSGFTGTYLLRALVARGERPISFDLVPPPADLRQHVDHVTGDVRSADDLRALPLGADDMVFHMAARQFHGSVPGKNRDAWFQDVNVAGTERVLEAMERQDARKLVFFSTDMTYGPPDRTPVPPDHPQRPFGPYGESKVRAEAAIRGRTALSATIFRPRLIAGAGRIGILAKLFTLIRANLPVPLIGNGGNRYQMIAIEDCVTAALRAADLGCPPGPFNLGSDDPPLIRDVLTEVIRRAGSSSFLVPTPSRLVKGALTALDRLGLTLLHPEQFRVADLEYVLDTDATKEALGWQPNRRDADILFEAYAQFSGTAAASKSPRVF